MTNQKALPRGKSDLGHQARHCVNQAPELENAGTADRFTEISCGLHKWLWFVEAHSQAPK